MGLGLVYMTTSAMAARYLMTGQLAYLRAQGFDVTLLSAGGVDQEVVAAREGVNVIPLPLEREISIPRDLRALWQIYRVLRRLRPAIVNAGTPKAALLGMIAATLARVPVRIYVLRGLRAETKRGVARFFFELLERLTAALAHRVVCVSASLRALYVARGLCDPKKTVVLGNGSSNGVDIARFANAGVHRERLRRELGLNPQQPVAGFVGRLTRDKGIEELIDAWEIVGREVPEGRLLIVGDMEKGDPLGAEAVRKLSTTPGIIRVPHQEDIAAFYGVLDVLAFPSHREGFPNVVIEAAAAGVPTVGARATGTVDAIEDGLTGSLVPRGDADALAAALIAYLSDVELRRKAGDAARQAARRYAPEEIWRSLRELYLDETRRRAPERLA